LPDTDLQQLIYRFCSSHGLQKTEVRGQKTDIRQQKADIRIRKSEIFL
jgi:hypothetical protein